MPVAFVEGNELRAAESHNRFRAFDAFASEQHAVALGAVRLLVLRRELQAGEFFLAVIAAEAFAMVRRIPVRYASLVDHLQHTEAQQTCQVNRQYTDWKSVECITSAECFVNIIHASLTVPFP
jgi:hypothetical protein